MATNTITLSGNLTKEPELAATPSGKFVLSFRVAVDAAGGGKETAGFFACQAWGDLAENLAGSLRKGQRVILTGQLRQRSFDANGQQRSTTEVLVQDAGPSLLWARAQVARRAPEVESEPAPA